MFEFVTHPTTRNNICKLDLMDSPAIPLIVDNIPKRRRPERTPDQISRKRDQDREAQRLSRERTRRRIEEAENRLAESEAATARSGQQLKQVTMERDIAQRESSSFRAQLESVCAQLDIARKQLASMAHLLGGSGVSNDSPTGTVTFSLPMNHAPQLQSPQPSEPQQLHKSPVRVERLSIRSMLHPSASPILATALENRPPMQVSRHALSRAGSSSHSSPSHGPEGSIYGSETSVMSWHSASAYLPKNCAPTCPMDSNLTIFTNSRRELLQQGEPEEVVLGPSNPALCVLPSLGVRSQVGMCHPVSQMLAEVMGTAEILQGLPEQIAVLWMTHVSLRVS